MELFTMSHELNIFQQRSLTDLLEYKWVEVGRPFNLLGCVAHFIYMFLLFVYIDQIYIHDRSELSMYFNICLCVGLIYPMFYEIYQIKRLGIEKYNLFCA
jgi:hypothetical protein